MRRLSPRSAIRAQKRALFGLVVSAAAFGCTEASTLRGRIRGLRVVVEQAEQNGAYHCAPRELALAQAHADFAQTELAQGDLDRAKAHFNLAEPNGRAAMRLSPPERCQSEARDTDGDGILDRDDRCPEEPEDFDAYEDEDGCPEDQDQDGDGLADSVDYCPTEPEDQDGFLDADGCPDLDNDVDRVADGADRCPIEAEDPDGFQDEDGCPDLDNDADSIPDTEDRCPNELGVADEQGCPRVYRNVEVTSSGIVIYQKIFFELNKAVIRRRSFPVLNTVAQVMRDFPDIRVEVQGHTDSRGRDEYNMTLSQARADSVRSYLIGQGIDPSRMSARGYGETQFIDTNSTRAGRANNRRVEFVRTDAAARSGTTGPTSGRQPGAVQTPGITSPSGGPTRASP